ncbi:helix-turn-helix domain-containing protein [Nonomuraea sp. NPDC050643]|uniref:arsenate reductase/protein-tyrosine-phosphatase family protein n=1 Tax=Nonomuraea sp. NPDC050643 TaxID=3155660 RepID=UPI0033FD70E0
MIEISELEQRAAGHAALGDPIRLAMVDELLLGDRSPGELGQAFNLSSNLLAHHLKVLQDAALITRARSESDRRRSYVRLLPDTLAGLTPTPSIPMAAERVVFVCTHNSARSQLAAALWGRRSHLPAASAGTEPAAHVHPRALSTARRHRLRLQPRGTAHVGDTVRAGDLVVAVCDSAYEHLPARPPLHWSVPDPVPADTDDAFERAYTDLSGRVDRLATALTPAVIPVEHHRPAKDTP